MDDDQQQRKTSSPATSLHPVSVAAQPQPSTASVPAKGPLISRRVFLVGALGASALLTVASVAGSGGILGPLFPPKEPPTVIAKATDLESKYQAAVSSNDVYTALGDPSNTKEYFSQFFYWPYTISDSPYYKNIVVRLPDDNLGVQLTDRSTVYTAPTGGRFVAYNTTCVHLQCLVIPDSLALQVRASLGSSAHATVVSITWPMACRSLAPLTISACFLFQGRVEHRRVWE